MTYLDLKYSKMAKKLTRGAELEIEKARNDARWADIPKLLNDVETSKVTLSGINIQYIVDVIYMDFSSSKRIWKFTFIYIM